MIDEAELANSEHMAKIVLLRERSAEAHLMAERVVDLVAEVRRQRERIAELEEAR